MRDRGRHGYEGNGKRGIKMIIFASRLASWLLAGWLDAMRRALLSLERDTIPTFDPLLTSGAISIAGFPSKNPSGFSENPVCSTFMIGKSSTLGT
eukprot:scaffold4586_cov152-Skeletonema_menzelii.AAC.2